MYIFVGVAIIADRFMAAIEQITSQEQDVIVRKPNGEKEIISVRIWNETVSNLTLMALGSSAPEILLSIIEIYAQGFEAGALGPGTIVGSAAFNMFVIIAILCLGCPRRGQKDQTLAWSSVLPWSSQFLLTFGCYISWSGLRPELSKFGRHSSHSCSSQLQYSWPSIADKRLLIYKYLDKRYRMKNRRKVVYSGSDATDGETLELTGVESNGIKVKVNDIEMKDDIKVFLIF